MARKKYCLFGFLMLLAGMCVLALAVRATWLPMMASWLDVGRQAYAVDYVMVMPGDENVRPFVAAAMVRTGLARQALVPDPELPTEVDRSYQHLSQSNMVRKVLLAQGVPASDVHLMPSPGKTTKGDLEALAARLNHHPDSTVAIVTSFYHTRRARWTARQVLGQRFDQVRIVSAPADGFDARNWWQVEDGMIVVINEYLKLAFYLVFES
jgi:uncharacterized SAM-binding protein YcdF (DUF218 family)